MNRKIFINANNTGYSTGQVRGTMTIGELISCLEQFNEDVPVYLKFDNGYTYGGITEQDFEDDDGEDEEEE
jgi:hypothetical protein